MLDESWFSSLWEAKNPARECINMKFPNSQKKSIQQGAERHTLLCAQSLTGGEQMLLVLSPAPTMHLCPSSGPQCLLICSIWHSKGLQLQPPHYTLALKVRGRSDFDCPFCSNDSQRSIRVWLSPPQPGTNDPTLIVCK